MGVERRLVVVAAPDVVNSALATYQKLVYISGRPADMSIRWANITLLVTAETNYTATWSANIARGQRNVHHGAVGAIIVITPDQAFS